MADLYVCPRCGETEDCGCQRLSSACDAMKKARETTYLNLGYLLAKLVERMPGLCPACEAACANNPAAACKLCAGVKYAKDRVAEARRA